MTAILLPLLFCLFNGTAFIDIDGDGQHGIIDRPLAGAAVVLTFGDGSVSLTTDEQGNVSYSGRCGAAKWRWPHGIRSASGNGLGLPDALAVQPYHVFTPRQEYER